MSIRLVSEAGERRETNNWSERRSSSKRCGRRLKKKEWLTCLHSLSFLSSFLRVSWVRRRKKTERMTRTAACFLWSPSTRKVLALHSVYKQNIADLCLMKDFTWGMLCCCRERRRRFSQTDFLLSKGSLLLKLTVSSFLCFSPTPPSEQIPLPVKASLVWIWEGVVSKKLLPLWEQMCSTESLVFNSLNRAVSSTTYCRTSETTNVCVCLLFSLREEGVCQDQESKVQIRGKQ